MTDLHDYDYEPYPGNPIPPETPGTGEGKLITFGIISVILICLLLPLLLSAINTSHQESQPDATPTRSVTPPAAKNPTVYAPTAMVGVAYNYPVSGPNGTYTATGLPAGLTISSAGVISGIPTTPGIYTITVTAVSQAQPPIPQNITLAVINQR